MWNAPLERSARSTGLVAAAVALAVAELLAGLNRSWRSPVLDVGDRVIDAAPPFVKEFAIDTFGTNDKPALLIGIAVFLGLYAAAVGVRRAPPPLRLRRRRHRRVRRDRRLGGAEPADRRAGPRRPARASPARSPGIGALWLIHRRLTRRRTGAPVTADGATDRRQFFRSSGAVLGALDRASPL